MKRFGMTKLWAFGITSVIALIVVASNTDPTETRRDNEGESVTHMAKAPSDASSSALGEKSTTDAARDRSGDSSPAASSPGDSSPAAGTVGDSGPVAGTPGHHREAGGGSGDVGPAVRSDSPNRAASPAATSPPTTSEKVEPRADRPVTTTTTTASKRWVQVANMNGLGDQRTAPFRLTGGEVRLRYDYDGDGRFLVAVAEPEPAGEQDKGIYYSDQYCPAPCQGTQRLNRQAGEYYVEVRSTGGPWSVVLEEYR